MRTMSPTLSRSDPVTRCPFTKVPLALPLSTSITCSFSRLISAGNDFAARPRLLFTAEGLATNLSMLLRGVGVSGRLTADSGQHYKVEHEQQQRQPRYDRQFSVRANYRSQAGGGHREREPHKRN